MKTIFKIILSILFTLFILSCSSVILTESQQNSIVSSLSNITKIKSIAILDDDQEPSEPNVSGFIRLTGNLEESIPVGEINESPIKTFIDTTGEKVLITNQSTFDYGYVIDPQSDTLLVVELLSELMNNFDLPKSSGVQFVIYHRINVTKHNSISPLASWESIRKGYTVNRMVLLTIEANKFYNDKFLSQANEEAVLEKSFRYNEKLYNKNVTELVALIKNNYLNFIVKKI